jgi:hypothetical protein
VDRLDVEPLRGRVDLEAVALLEIMRKSIG